MKLTNYNAYVRNNELHETTNMMMSLLTNELLNDSPLEGTTLLLYLVANKRFNFNQPSSPRRRSIFKNLIIGHKYCFIYIQCQLSIY